MTVKHATSRLNDTNLNFLCHTWRVIPGKCEKENKATAFKRKLWEYLLLDAVVAAGESVCGSELLDSCLFFTNVVTHSCVSKVQGALERASVLTPIIMKHMVCLVLHRWPLNSL